MSRSYLHRTPTMTETLPLSPWAMLMLNHTKYEISMWTIQITGVYPMLALRAQWIMMSHTLVWKCQCLIFTEIQLVLSKEKRKVWEFVITFNMIDWFCMCGSQIETLIKIAVMTFIMVNIRWYKSLLDRHLRLLWRTPLFPKQEI
jgi:hypothetical protein